MTWLRSTPSPRLNHRLPEPKRAGKPVGTTRRPPWEQANGRMAGCNRLSAVRSAVALAEAEASAEPEASLAAPPRYAPHHYQDTLRTPLRLLQFRQPCPRRRQGMRGCSMARRQPRGAKGACESRPVPRPTPPPSRERCPLPARALSPRLPPAPRGHRGGTRPVRRRLPLEKAAPDSRRKARIRAPRFFHACLRRQIHIDHLYKSGVLTQVQPNADL